MKLFFRVEQICLDSETDIQRGDAPCISSELLQPRHGGALRLIDEGLLGFGPEFAIANTP